MIWIITGMFSAKAQAPPWQWAKAAHTTASEYATGVAFDPSSGNMVSVGIFNSDLSAFFGPQFVGAVGGGYVAKYDPLGNIIWAFPIGNDQDDACNGVTVDMSGNIYVTGYLQQIADFKGMGTVSTILNSAGGKDIFLAKYNPAGQLLWVTRAGGTTDDEGTAVCVTPNGAYITGYYTGTANFGAVQLLVLSGADNKAYTAAYDVNGNSLWATTIGNSGSEAFGSDICADNANVFVTGKFTGASVNVYDAGLLSILSLLFPSATLNNSAASSYDGFTASFTASGGSYNWAGVIHSNNNDYSNGITQAGSNLYITGATSSSASFPGYASNPVAVSASGLDLFTAQLNKLNGNTTWVKSEPGSNDQQGTSIGIDTLNLITVGGYFDGGINFTGGTSITSSGNEDVFVATYNTAGTFQWVTQAGSNGTDIAHALTTGNLGEIYVVGEYENNAVFGTNTLIQDSPPNIFAAKLACPPIVNNIISSAQILCVNQTPAGLTGSIPLGSSGTYSYLWQQSLDNVTWTNAVGTNNTQNYTPPMLTVSTYYQRVVTATGGCSNISTSNSVLIAINQLPTGAIAGADQIICANNATLTANNPTVGTGIWTVYTGSGNIATPANYTSTVNSLNTGANSFVWTISNGVCPSSSDTVKINVYAQPTLANAGSNQSLCSTTNTTLSANTPSIGTGVWTILSGTSTITSPNTNTTSIAGLSLGQNAFVWTISNGSCTSTKDTVFVQVSANPSPAIVASNQTVCAGTTTLSATAPSVGTGVWSLLSGSGTIVSPSTNTTSVTGLSVGQNNFLWTVSSGACAPVSNTLTIQVDAPPSIASGTTNQNICASSTLLNANSPTVGSGAWSVISGSGTISSVHTNTTSVTGLSIGQNLFLWSITNGVCPASTDTFKVKVDAVPSPATAGGDQTICSSSSVLSATVPAVGNGTWHVLTGSSTLLSPATYSTGVMGLTVGVNSFEWVVSNGVCPVNIDTVLVMVNAPPSPAQAGSDKSICTSSYTLNALAPATGSGNWNVLFGGTASVTNPGLNNSPATGLSIGSNTFEWVISNGVCPVNRDTVVITVNALPILSITGNTVICNGTSTTLTASGADTYTWSGGSNTNTYSVTPIISTTYTVSGTNTVTTCSNTAIQTVMVKPTLFSSQTLTVCAGGSVTVGTTIHSTSGIYTDVLTGSNGCDSTVTTNLTVRLNITYTQSPVVCYGQSYSVGTHTYTASGTYTDILTSSSTGCDSTVTTNLTVRSNITYTQSPIVCYGQSYSVGTHTYTASGTYTDILTSSSTGCDSTVTINLTVRSAIASTQNFTICTGQSINIGSSSYSSAGTYTNVLTSFTGCDSVVVTHLQVDSMPTIASAGHDSTIYNSFMLLSGNVPMVGTGIWSVVSGSANFADNTHANTEISNLENGQSVLQWTISNGVCPVSFDEITITVKSLNIPNGFSPNGDGVNDAFEIPGLDEFSNVKLNVFNRWGSSVYDSKDYRNNWIGKNMSGEDLSDDTYFFTLEISDKKRYEGYVVLKRK